VKPPPFRRPRASLYAGSEELRSPIANGRNRCVTRIQLARRCSATNCAFARACLR
jgi:hypothetical protein